MTSLPPFLTLWILGFLLPPFLTLWIRGFAGSSDEDILMIKV